MFFSSSFPLTRPRLIWLTFGLSLASQAQTNSTAILIVAGQSNVLNWHADATAFPSSILDQTIPFWHVSGAPPERGRPINASSNQQWIPLSPQRQEPFQRYHRDFFGPEMTLARSLAGDGRPVAVIKVAFFGSNLARDWSPSATQGNLLYRRLLQEISKAVARLSAQSQGHHLAGFFWMQGESDANRLEDASAYATNLAEFIEALRRDLAMPDLPFILGRVGPRPTKGYAHQEIVRAAQVSLIDSTRRAAWVDTDDLPRDTDGIHLVASGVLGLGNRWAEAWRKLQRSPRESSGAPSLRLRSVP